MDKFNVDVLISVKEEMATPSKSIYRFYTEEGYKNVNGVTLKQMINYDHSAKESYHNYIQWMFPIAEMSRFSDFYITETDVKLLKKSPTVKKRSIEALVSMFDFYGYRMNTPFRGKNPRQFLVKKKDSKYVLFTHNYSRMSRMIKFFVSMGMEFYAMLVFLMICDLLETNKEFKRLAMETQAVEHWRDLFKRLILKE